MKRTSKILLVTLLFVCFISTLMACSSNEVTDNKETTSTTAKNKTTEPATEEPTTEEASTEYVFKGYEFNSHPDGFNLQNDWTINSGDFIYINDYVSNSDEDYDSIRGSYAKILLIVTETENQNDLLNILMEKYMQYGDSTIYIPHADNYSFEYVGNKKVVFKFIKYNEDGELVFDVYKE